MRRKRIVVMAAVAALLGVALVRVLPSDRPVASPWAAEAIEWFDALNHAADLGPDLGPAHVAIFYDPVAAESLPATFAPWYRHPGDELPMPDAIYLDVEGMVTDWGMMDIGSSGVITRQAGTYRASGYLWDATRAERAVAAAYLRAWSAKGSDGLRTMYAPGARLVDSLHRVELVGRGAIERYAARLRASEATRITQDTVRGMAPTERWEAIYTYWWWPHDLYSGDLHVAVAYRADDGTGCPDRTLAALTVSDGLVTAERRYHLIESVRRCMDTDRLPSGWWTGVPPPAFRSDAVTGIVAIAGQRIEIHNGTEGLERLVRWAVERYELAGLAVPAVSSIAFDADVHTIECADRRHGLTVDEGGGRARIYACIGEGDACTDATCASFTPLSRQLLVHELAHAWMDQNLAPATRQAFLERFGLDDWEGTGLPWAKRGVEQAAQVLAGGLMDQPMDTARLADRTCEEISDAFELLTGVAPLQTRCVARPS